MNDTTPRSITDGEWMEIANVALVRDLWGLASGDDGAALRLVCYGARFDFVSGCPGYCGDVFLLQGDALTDAPPLLLFRRDGELVAGPR